MNEEEIVQLLKNISSKLDGIFEILSDNLNGENRLSVEIGDLKVIAIPEKR